MTERRKHLFSLLLAFALVLGLPFPALAAGETVAINETNFPDPAFRTYVAERFDENEDHQLSQAERNDVQYIDVRGQDDSLGSITSLEGVEFFPNLEMLWCGYNRLSSLDLSGCSRLTYLNCEGNQINMLDVSGCKELETLECKDNNLITLDVSNNTALVLLYCENNEIAELDVSNAPSLQQLFCYNNNLVSLDVSKNTALDFLDCSSNKIATLDVRNHDALGVLICSENQLTNLDISNNVELSILDCTSNRITSLDVGGNLRLHNLFCSDNQLASLDVSKNTALTDLWCGGNQLTTLDVRMNAALTDLNCNANQLTSLDVSMNTALTSLSCSYNQLTTLDVSKNTALWYLGCNENQLTSLDLSNNTNLGKGLFEPYIGTSSYSISVNTNRTVDMSGLPGKFNVSKVSNLVGGTMKGNILTVEEGVTEVTYTYDTDSEYPLNVTLKISQDKPQEYDVVYRVYNPGNGKHHYTTDAAERDFLAANGWIYEGVACPATITTCTPWTPPSGTVWWREAGSMRASCATAPAPMGCLCTGCSTPM